MKEVNESEVFAVHGIEVRIVPLEFMPVIGYEQVRKHRKRRINKKWLKRYGCRPIHDRSRMILFNPDAGNQVLLVTQEQYNLLKEMRT